MQPSAQWNTEPVARSKKINYGLEKILLTN